MDEHREAVNYDLIKVGYTIEDIGGALPWSAFNDFLKKIGPDSALIKEMDPEGARWATTLKTNEILADIFDLLAYFRNEVVYRLAGQSPKEPQLYKRPGAGQKEDKKKHIGQGALPMPELEEWIKNRLKGGN